jgi:hypothetical protein
MEGDVSLDCLPDSRRVVGCGCPLPTPLWPVKRTRIAEAGVSVVVDSGEEPAEEEWREAEAEEAEDVEAGGVLCCDVGSSVNSGFSVRIVVCGVRPSKEGKGRCCDGVGVGQPDMGGDGE